MSSTASRGLDLGLVPLPGARTGRDPARSIKRGPSRVPPEVVAATQRDRLYDALVHTVAEKGYVNARVSDICQAAGVTRPAFYALFKGKDDAFIATYRHGTGVLLRLMGEAYSSAGDWRAGARATLAIMLDVLATVPAFAAMAIVEIEAVGPAAREERNLLLSSFDRFFADAPLESDVPLPEELVRSIVGGVYTTLYRYVSAGRVAELPQLLPVLTYFVMVPFLGHDEAVREVEAGASITGKNVAPCAPDASNRR
jgi:AcrR family transcriptional regulator